MTLMESILRYLPTLTPRDQVRVAILVHRLSAASQQEQAEMLQQTHGILDDEIGEVREQTMHAAHADAHE